jgi:predicted DNA-binding protein
MNYLRFSSAFLLFLLLTAQQVKAQLQLDTLTLPSEKAIRSVVKDLDRLNKQLQRSSTVYIKALEITEKGINQFKDSILSIQHLDKLNLSKKYSSKLDSIATGLNLTKSLSPLKAESDIDHVQAQLTELTDELHKAEKIKSLLETNLQHLSYFQKIKSIEKQITQYKKLSAGYNARISEAQELLKQPDKFGKRLLSELRQQPAFQKYFAKYSELARLFPSAESPTGNMTNITGLQQRDQLMEQIKTAMGGTSFDPIHFLQTNPEGGQQNNPITHATQSLQKKIKAISTSNYEDPGYKGLSFMQRVFFQTNVQSSSGNRWLPSHTNFAIGSGYKINSKAQLSAEIVWRMGWGQPIKNIHITHQGFGLRSFLDWKVKGQWWITGSYEKNHYPSYQTIAVASNDNGWRNSALMGISKTIAIKSKGMKKFKMQLLYDFLAPSQAPYTSPWKYRMGYTF